MNLIAKNISNYELLDSGFGSKLERIAGLLVERPCPQAIWAPSLPPSEWKKAESICIRQKDGGGHWKHVKADPGEKTLEWNNLKFILRLTSFGHCGVFFEQEPIWTFLYENLKNKKDAKFLNLFGYTGAASLSAAQAGASVFHVDSAKGVLTWGAQNAALSKLPENSIRWIQEDARAFVKHSLKKGFTYNAILADPPSWGHGKDKKDVWEFEKDLYEFATDCAKLLTPDGILILSCHTHGVQQQALYNLVEQSSNWKKIESGEFGILHKNDNRILPAGIVVIAQR